MKSVELVARDGVLLVARLVAGVILVAHVWQRWRGGLGHQEAVLSDAGLPTPTLLVFLVLGFEVLGGVLLAFGLATRLVGLGMVLMNVLIIFTTRIDGGLYLADGGWEYNATLAVLGAFLLCLGAGRTGIDQLFRRPKGDDDMDLIEDETQEEYE